jgi:polysaccharide export outer membrane protein
VAALALVWHGMAPPALASQAQAGTAKPAAGETTTSENRGAPAGFRIGAGDVLQINVWKEPEASVPAAVVRPDGKISLPLVKELDVQGLTPTELEKLLTAKLDQYIHGADVTVVIKEIRSKRVYLVGAVKREGTIPLLSNMSVLQVLAEAGGLTEYAKKKKIYVLREENGKRNRYPFDYEAVIKGEHMDENIAILPDDTIVVPQ